MTQPAEPTEPKYPLSWPSYVPRAKSRSRAIFRSQNKGANSYMRSQHKTMTDALDALQSEMDKLEGASQMVLSTNVETRLDGKPRAGQASVLPDPGAALYFNRASQRLCLPCDRWDRVEDNIYAIAMHIGAMRGMERWGVGTVEQAFAGYKALSAGEEWWDVLCCRRDSKREVIEAQYKARIKSAHPDVPGGSHEAMQRLNIARDQGIAELGSLDRLTD